MLTAIPRIWNRARKVKKRVKYDLSLVFARLRRRYYRLLPGAVAPGSPSWLAEREIRYGGLQAGARRKQSPFAPGNYYSWTHQIHQGGDRMLKHAYAPVYSRYLQEYIQPRKEAPITLVEIGVLHGTGLAIWSELFPSARIIGLDIDLSYIEGNMDQLLARGAFKNGLPELYEFDQFRDDNREFFRELLGEDTVDICIDDASHDKRVTARTFLEIQPHLATNACYFIEDCPKARRHLPALPPGHQLKRHGKLLVIRRRGHP